MMRIKEKPEISVSSPREMVGALKDCRVRGFKDSDDDTTVIFHIRDITQDDVGKIGVFANLDGFDIHPTGYEFEE